MKRVLLAALTVTTLTLGATAPVAAATPNALTSKAGASSASVYFSPGSSTLTASARRVLTTVVDERSSGFDFAVAGYVQRAGADDNNRSLSLARAQAVRAFLLNAGVEGAITAQGKGVFARNATSAAARVAVVTWTAIDEEPAPTPEPTPTPTPTPTPAPTTCTVVFDAQGPVAAAVESMTVTPGAVVTLPRVAYGLGDFAGWFTSPNNGRGRVDDAGAFVGFAAQQATLACVAGSTRTLYAHWVVPSAPAQYPQLHVRIEYMQYSVGNNETVTISGCAVDCPIEVYSYSEGVDQWTQFDDTLTVGAGGTVTFTMKSAAPNTQYWSWYFANADDTFDYVWVTQVNSFDPVLTFTTPFGTFVRTIVDDVTVTVVFTATPGLTGVDSLVISPALG